MQYKLSNILFFGILLQVVSTQGIITFNLFKLLGDWELKSFLHPIGILVVIIYYLLKFANGGKFKYSGIDLLLFLYFTICIFILVLNVSDSSSFLFTFREVILIFLLIFLYGQTSIPLRLWRKILGLLYILVLGNLLFILLTYVYGPEEYMKLVTGRFIWPIDSEYKFKISNFYVFWRSPALIGETAAVGHFGLLSYFLFREDEIYKRKKLFPLLLVLLTFVRSVYLVLLVFFVFRFFLKKKNLFKLEVILPYLIPLIFLIAIPFYNFKLLSLKSIMARFDHWINDLNVKFNLFIGGAIGKVGGAVRGDGFVSTLDSYWLLMLVSTGIIGIVLIILFMKEKAADNQRMKIILISFLCAAFFVTITQSIPFLVLFPLLFIKKETNIRT
ncbi:hypothetical protein DKG77_03165 [Flagellimonas aquimarina]|uniref:O-antigen ligase domain-containing protein n=1 Tax=Flagellimonas aquimarina TaxID=2201895 RepID=A0A316L6E7_9FLAO|nr:hypothetical protein [Allomuricauda koreensis]PWL39843.1 hypothetical protein DKG77_03165 [Allomuricauda koreensis]